MNIALFTETYYPEVNGVANSVFMLKMELEKRGHNVYVFTTTTPGSPDYEFNVFRVHSMPCILLTERRVGMFYQPKLAHIIKRLNLDLIHTHTEFSLGIFGRIMAKELGLPLIHTYHTIYEDYTHYVTKGKILDPQAKAFVRMFTRVCCNTVQRVIVPTEKVRDLLLTYEVVREMSVIPTGIDLGKFHPDLFSAEQTAALKKQFGIPGTDRIILYLGRVSPEKNLQEVLRVMPDYLGLHKDVSMVVVGGGPAKEPLRQEAAELGLAGRVHFLGEQPWDRIGEFYQMGDVFVSASNSETQGLTYIEAMAAGLPVVAREDPCLEGILLDGWNGFAFTDRDGLIRGLDLALFGEDAAQYGQNAIQKAAEYSTESFADAVENVYEEVLESQHQRFPEVFAEL